MSDWKALAEKELRGRAIPTSRLGDARGHPVKPLYTAADVAGLPMWAACRASRPSPAA
jgi:methylmalonyl-CoA mutase